MTCCPVPDSRHMTNYVGFTSMADALDVISGNIRVNGMREWRTDSDTADMLPPGRDTGFLTD